jgi:ferric-dicitrate binding protein FerR (iron transport regulator)
MEKNVIIKLIEQSVSGQASASDQNRLKEELAKNPEFQEMYDEYMIIWDLSKPKKDTVPSFNAETAADKFKASLKQAPKAKKVSLFPKIMKIAAVFVVLTVAGFFLTQYLGLNENEAFVNVTSLEDQQNKVNLKDGSNIILAKGGSVLTYSEKFNESNRNVALDGKAYFDIAKDKSKPFIITTDLAQVSVLGTKFTVNTLEDGLIEVIVEEGSVSLSPLTSSKSITLKAGEKGIFNNVTKQLYKRVTNINQMAWATHKLSFKNKQFSDVIRDLQSYYEVEIAITDDRILECHYTSLFVDEDIDDILETIATAYKFSIRSNDSKTSYTLVGGNCN